VSARDALAARAAETAQRHQQRDDAPPAPARAVPDKVRQTFDVSGRDHLRAAALRMETAVTLGRTQLTAQDFYSAMLAEVLDNDDVARRVRLRLERG
jgi:hypothetical protein